MPNPPAQTANAAPKIGNAGKGRPKGARNRHTTIIKEAVIESLGLVGGAHYLAEVARSEPAAYLRLLGQVLPLQVNASVTHDVPGLPEIAEAIKKMAKEF